MTPTIMSAYPYSTRYLMVVTTVSLILQVVQLWPG